MTDYISKKDALAQFVDGKDFTDTMLDIEDLPSIEASEDCISRACAIEIANNPIEIRLELALSRLPSVLPVRPSGEWIYNDSFTCSRCGFKMIAGDGAYNYCPNCGADMRGDSNANN